VTTSINFATPEKLFNLRKRSIFNQTELASILYGDPKKRQRIGKIERGEVEIGFSEGLAWIWTCSDAAQRKEVKRAVKVLKQFASKHKPY